MIGCWCIQNQWRFSNLNDSNYRWFTINSSNFIFWYGAQRNNVYRTCVCSGKERMYSICQSDFDTSLSVRRKCVCILHAFHISKRFTCSFSGEKSLVDERVQHFLNSDVFVAKNNLDNIAYRRNVINLWMFSRKKYSLYLFILQFLP